jgi:hypothetical protein
MRVRFAPGPAGSLHDGARAIVREPRAVRGHPGGVRQALTGDVSGPGLWSVLAALPRDEPLPRIDAAV